jgi:nucleoside-diphosphate-sugar epimerase
MRILLTGVDGYIGVRLAPILLAEGHAVTGIDTGYYRDGWLYTSRNEQPRTVATINKYIRRIEPRDLEGLDAVVHLAELSNDPLGENNPQLTYQINHEGSVSLAKMARAAGVSRFVYASSCSVYGKGASDIVSEASPTNPQTAYAHCKVRVENDLGAMASADFAPVFLRNATAYGASPRMRFDIVLNDLCALAWTTKRIAMTSDGSPWRPIVHVEDICRAIVCALAAPAEKIRGQIFNVGADSENYRVREIAQVIGETMPGCEVTTGSSAGDNRSYRVSFAKIAAGLPGFATKWTARKGAEELRALFERIELDTATHAYRAFTRIKQLRYLTRTGQIDSEFYWRT